MRRRSMSMIIIGLGLGLAGLAQAASVQLQWDYIQEPSHLATGFVVERCTGATCTNFVAITTVPLPLSPPIFNDTTVAPATSYRWQVRAIDAAGQAGAASNAVGFSVPQNPLAAPTNLRGTIVP